MKGLVALLIRWRSTKYDYSPAYPPQLTSVDVPLVRIDSDKLDFEGNRIANEAVQYLADALKINRVRQSLFALDKTSVGSVPFAEPNNAE